MRRKTEDDLRKMRIKNKKGYGSKFSHKNESASPGFYKVKLDKNDIDVEIASTERCTIHSYKFSTYMEVDKRCMAN